MSEQEQSEAAQKQKIITPSNKVLSLDEIPENQEYGDNPTEVRETSQYQTEYVENFVERWDELIDWDARAEGEGTFFIDILRKLGKENILDVATGTGFHSVQLLKAGFNVTSADGNAQMLVKAFENARERGYVMRSVHADWRWLNHDIQDQLFDAVICLGNSFTHLHEEHDRRRALAEFYSALKHDGVLIMDQRNYDSILDNGFSSKHKYYYCGDRVSAEPVYVDDGLARFEYTFEDGSKHHLNMYPLRKDYTRSLISDAGFQKIETYGDFQETYAEEQPDFYVHVAHKDYYAK
ncbi:MAG: SAM-dependent methyltransferase [Gammaproteobacteria bacterium]|nr:SAM-dependent methyltransferase [Gammaproteobacteria bacterium]|tara:strand:- start:2748 stop:3629 length:882 start_codon:yes stop_codon:yes gene_type:complete